MSCLPCEGKRDCVRPSGVIEPANEVMFSRASLSSPERR